MRPTAPVAARHMPSGLHKPWFRAPTDHPWIIDDSRATASYCRMGVMSQTAEPACVIGVPRRLTAQPLHSVWRGAVLPAGRAELVGAHDLGAGQTPHPRAVDRLPLRDPQRVRIPDSRAAPCRP